jgi:polysaccharide export outer membrane protein
LAIVSLARGGYAQSLPNDVDPQTAQAIQAAIQRGDTLGAKKLYDDYKNAKAAVTPQAVISTKPSKLETPSIFENALSGKLPPTAFTADLQQFGYDNFMKTVSSFAPAATTPVGPEYIIGPGDQFTITLWGTTEGIYTLQVTKEGNITLPKVGVVPVAGLKFEDLETTIRKHLSKYYSNFNLSIAMGTLKTITVFVAGEVENPGGYSVSSLFTVYNALFAAGGPTKKGTLRTIQILRSGKVVKTLDLYDFLLRGDRSQAIRLRHEDTIFVQLIGPIAGVSGAVYRPAIYELKGGETLSDVLQTAGGIMPLSLASRVQVTRYSENQKKVILDIQVASQASDPSTGALKEKVMNMDVVHVLPIYDKVWETVSLQGDVRNPGELQWRQDLKLKEVIQTGQLLPTADLKKVEVIRLTNDYRDRQIIPINLDMIMKGDESQNILMMPKDEIRVFTLYRGVEKVKIAGEVMSPGEFGIKKGDRLSDLLRRVGGFTPEAYPYGIAFQRKDVKNTQDKNLQNYVAKMQAQIIQSAAASATEAVTAESAAASKAELHMNQGLLENLKNLQAQSEGRVSINITDDINQWTGSKDDLLLKDGDTIIVPKRPQEVIVVGEVHSPSAQIFIPGFTVKDYIDLTGGFTNSSEKDQVYVVQANGFAYGSDSPSIGNVEKAKLQAGDTVFVPQKTERNVGWRYFKDTLDILFKTAIIVATLTVVF